MFRQLGSDSNQVSRTVYVRVCAARVYFPIVCSRVNFSSEHRPLRRYRSEQSNYKTTDVDKRPGNV